MADLHAIFVGLTVVDIHYYGLNDVRVGRKNQAPHAEFAPGGPAANAARICSSLGVSATLVSALGHGPMSSFAASRLEESAVRLVDLAPPSFRGVPVSAVAVESAGERTIISNAPQEMEVLADFSLSHLLPDAPVLIDCHYPNVAHFVADLARARGGKVVLDIGSKKPWTDDLMSVADVAIVSREFEPEGCSLEEWASHFPNVFIAVSSGPRPVEWRLGSQAGSVSVPVVDAVDTNGAGDVLHGAFMANLQLQPKVTDWLETAVAALTAATYVASQSCTRRGVL